MLLEELRVQLDNATSISAKSRLVRGFANDHTSPIIQDDHVIFFYISEDARTVAL